jgi:uncharacterized LabA/DUF88 family protein
MKVLNKDNFPSRTQPSKHIEQPDKSGLLRIAVLIDADNSQPKIARLILAKIAKYGTAFVKRAYDDWTGTNLQTGNNSSPTQRAKSTDSTMLIDAMDLLHSRQYEGSCLVSSDSDFTRLATRIRRQAGQATLLLIDG